MTMATDLKISALTISQRSVEVAWADGRHSTFHHMWLRDNCPQLLHASTGHRVVETSVIPADVYPASAVLDGGGAMAVTWAHDGHVSTFLPEWLRANDYSNGASHVPPTVTPWDASEIGPVLPRCTHDDLLHDTGARIAFLDGLFRYGVAILSEVPCEPGTVLQVGSFLGEIRVTSWGEVFDVISMPEANSVAYTSLPLVTHTDEGYRDPAPTVQLQHFLVADAAGGASTLVDGFRVAEDLRRDRPDLFELLATTILDFHFADATAEHHGRGPVISVHPDGSIRQIRYSNHSALPFRIPVDRMEAYYEAYRTFGKMRESDQYCLRIALGAGDMYIVDNHRVLHGRTGFSSSGARHLQSCYIERDEVASRLAVLKRLGG
jgi:gamma-butyrobetaine dioxygenase